MMDRRSFLELPAAAYAQYVASGFSRTSGTVRLKADTTFVDVASIERPRVLAAAHRKAMVRVRE